MKEIRPQAGPQEKFLSTPADIALYGGAAGGGKTFALLMEALRHISNKGYRAAIFRRTYPEITEPGSLWDKSQEIYPMIGSSPSVGNLKHIFPSGAEIQFLSCQYESDVSKYQGMQVAFLGFDELTHFTEKQFFYLLSRNRSTCGVRPYVRATCNPDSDSWVAEFIEWWIDQDTGIAIPERSGVIRWFIRLDGILHWANTPEELIEKYGDEVEPKSFTFVPASLQDNRILMLHDPGYLANLKSLHYVEQERLLGGNWKVSDNDGAYWQYNPEYFESHIWAEGWPDSFELSAIAVDPSLGLSKNSDYSANVFIGVTSGCYFVDADIKRRTTEQLAEDGIDFYLEHSPDVIGCEQNGFQRLMEGQYQQVCRNRRIPPVSFAKITNTVNKEVRIKRLGPDLAAKRIRIRNNEGGQILYKQLRTFGIKGAHDDGPDALEMGKRLLFALSGRSYQNADMEMAV